MTQTLILLRHAKSDWDDEQMRDIDRPLSPRGREAAPLMGTFLRLQGLVPHTVLCSPAQRTRETWTLVQEALSATPEVLFEDDLYLASPETMLKHIRLAPKGCETLMLIGHNPGMEYLAMQLTANTEHPHYRTMAHKFPTAGLAVFGFQAASWRTVGLGKGQLLQFASPRGLATGR